MKNKGYKHWLVITVIKITENHGWEGPQGDFALPKEGASRLLLPEGCTSIPFCITPAKAALHQVIYFSG